MPRFTDVAVERTQIYTDQAMVNFAALAEFESELIRERTMAGLDVVHQVPCKASHISKKIAG